MTHRGGVLLLAGARGCAAVLACTPLSRTWRDERRGRKPGWQVRSRPRPDPRQTRLAPTPKPGRLVLPVVATVACLIALIVVGDLGTVITERIRPSQATDQGFRLGTDAAADGEVPGENLPPLDHPPPPGLKENRPEDSDPETALMDSPYSSTPEFRYVESWVFDPTGGWRPMNPYRHRDFSSRYINRIDGTRKTWAPTPCTCTRLRVWVYGGSTTFGLHQRDDHTIWSELARVAADSGMALDISNRGDMGQLHWQEAERFRFDLLAEEPPDLVIFYDGANDTWASNAAVVGPDGEVTNPIDPTLDNLWADPELFPKDPPDPVTGGRLLPIEGRTLSQTAKARLTIDRYDRSRALSRSAARAANTPVRYVWQPTRYSRDVVLTEPHSDAGGELYPRMADQLQASFLPDDVINLTNALDGDTEPLFTDDIHHNERGSRLIAVALFDELEATLRSLIRKADDR